MDDSTQPESPAALPTHEAFVRLQEVGSTTDGVAQLRQLHDDADCVAMMQQMAHDERRCKGLVNALRNGSAVHLVRTAVRRAAMSPAEVDAEIREGMDAAVRAGLSHSTFGQSASKNWWER